MDLHRWHVKMEKKVRERGKKVIYRV